MLREQYFNFISEMFKSFTDPKISTMFASESTNVSVVIQLNDNVSYKMHIRQYCYYYRVTNISLHIGH